MSLVLAALNSSYAEKISPLRRGVEAYLRKRNHGKFFSLLVASLSGDHPKFAVVVSKKIAAKAVERNRIKRRTRSALLKCFRVVSKPSALVLYAKPDAKNAEFSELLRDIEALFSKL